MTAKENSSALTARAGQTGISKRPERQRREWLLGMLIALAEARGADVSAEGFDMYTEALIVFPDEDLQLVIDRTARMKRGEGEKAWPTLGDLVDPLLTMRGRRRREEKARQEREAEIAEFWRMVPGWMQITGRSVAEILERWPSFKGTKPR